MMASGNAGRHPDRAGWHGMRKQLLSGVALSVVLGAAAHAQTTETTAKSKKSVALESVTVTAQRRSQNLQDVPISIQALTGVQLKRLNIENFDDLIKQLPNVTQGGFGPGQANIYMRGLSIGGDEGGQGGGGVGSFPNVAVYLDDQSAQVPGKNLDLYSVDLQRVEVLEGPQGTLFGSGAQGGVVRYITNKPNLDKFEATVDAGIAGTEHGAPSGNIDLMVNYPIVKDKAALRVVMYDDERGGYIDNVPGTLKRESSDLGIHYAGYTNNVPGPATSTNSINNYKLASKNINPVTYQGARGEFEVKFDEDWTAVLAESAQRLDAQGVFYEMPESSGSNPVKLPDLSVQTFEPSYDKDFFENTALTINGRIGALNLVYDGAYLIRNATQVQDYTNYARGAYADYYQCHPANAAKGQTAQCFSPGATWQDIEHDTHLSQEMRLSTPDNWRLRAIGGFFYEDFKIQDETNFNYATVPGFIGLGPAPGSTVVDPNPRSSNTGFFNDITRGYSQYALFGSADFDIIPHVLTVTAGTRWYDFHNYEKGDYSGGFGCGPGPYQSYFGPPPCLAGAHNLDAQHYQSANYGFKSRVNITWKITPDIMVYYTFSEGYRPGGFNRSPPYGVVTNAEGTTTKTPGSVKYASDKLTNNEVGYKMQFLDHTLTVDGAFYQEDWDNVQDRLFDPLAFGTNLAFTENGPNYRVRGAEVAVTERPIQGLTINGSFAANDTRQLNSPPFYSETGVVLPNTQGVFGEVGDTLALSPAFKGNIRARYEYAFGDYLTFLQFGVQHSAHTHSAVSNFHNFYQAPFTTCDMSLGVDRGNWRASVYVENLTNKRAQEFISAAQFVTSVIVNRPLTGGLKLTYNFN
jgi:iron complex outermembrane receptor protein